MKFTLSWLKDHLDTDADAAAIGRTLTRIGLELEGIANPGAALADFRVARVLTAERHPQADKLQVLSVDAGDGPIQVVCGAPNARAGMTGVFGPPGAYVPGSDMTLKVAAIRGVTSNGMMCSARELEIGEGHDGILELPDDAPVGASFPSYAGLDDPVFDVAITPNRPDCMGVRGIARDLAAAGLGTLKPLAVPSVAATGAGPDVRTDDSQGCPAFFAQTVSGVRNGTSPDWLTRRLTAIGQKPISALVDITNYVMIDLGRPLHVYDRVELTGPLVARRAREGEQVLALNGRSYPLDPSMTVIADDAAVHDIGGIMGGEHSGVSETTTDVLIECAFFDPDRIALTGQKLQLTSDARQRFERGVDPAFLDEGLAIATDLVVRLCGGVASGVTHAGSPPLSTRQYAYDPTLAETLGGNAVAPERQRAILESLGFAVADDWQVTPPTWRRDVDGPADLVEEVIRIDGIDKVASVPLPRVPGVARPTATPEQKLERRLRRAAAARGLNEAVTWSFVSKAQAAVFGGGAWTLANPISEELKVMRPSLLPGLLAAAERNLRRGAAGVRLFELGRRYLADAERPTLGLVLAGDRTARGWRSGKAAPFDAVDAKALALALLAEAGAPTDNLQVFPDAGDAWHPGQSATLRLGPKTVLAAFGMVHPSVLKAFALSGAIAAVELYLDALPAPPRERVPAPGLPAAYAPSRDSRLRVPRTRSACRQRPDPRDPRRGQGGDRRPRACSTCSSATGVKSMALEVTLQPGDKSFTDAELKAVADKVVGAAAKLGAELRG